MYKDFSCVVDCYIGEKQRVWLPILFVICSALTQKCSAPHTFVICSALTKYDMIHHIIVLVNETLAKMIQTRV